MRTKYERTTILTTSKFKRRIKAAAEVEGITMSQYIKTAIKNALNVGSA